jgi:hypothetical protein
MNIYYMIYNELLITFEFLMFDIFSVKHIARCRTSYGNRLWPGPAASMYLGKTMSLRFIYDKRDRLLYKTRPLNA